MNNAEPQLRRHPEQWHRMTAEEAANKSIRLSHTGAQSTVFRLPDYFNYDASPTASLYDTVEISRVLKIAHSPKRTESAIEAMNIEFPDTKARKVARLITDNRMSTISAIEATRQSPRLEQLFGHPRYVPPIASTSWKEKHHFAYSQDFARPLWDIFAQLDTEHSEDDLREACRIIDLYIDTQLFLCSKGIFDQTFKLLDNCAIGAQEALHLVDGNAGFRIIDIGELSFYDLTIVIECIREKEWRKTATRPEYTPLPPSARAYFDEAFDARFTEEAVRSIWATNLAIEPGAIGAEADLTDLKVLNNVAELLWHKESQR